MLVIAAITACAKVEDVTTPSIKTIIGYTDNDEATKTALQNAKNIVWNTNDKIRAYGQRVSYESTKTTIYASGSQATFEFATDIEDEFIYAAYPASAAAPDIDTVEGFDWIDISIPTEQTAVKGSFADNTNAAIAFVKDGDIAQFKNVGALLNVEVKNDNITAIKISAPTKDEEGRGIGMTGLGSAAIDNNETVSTICSLENDGVDHVELKGTFENGSKYYFVVFPGDYENIAIQFTNTSGQTATFNSSATLNLSRNANVKLFNAVIPDSKWVSGETPGPVDGTVLWSEDFGYTLEPSQKDANCSLIDFTDFSKTASISYSSVNNVAVYFDCPSSSSNILLGSPNELLIGKKSKATVDDGGVWTITNIPTLESTSATLNFKCNKAPNALSIVSSTAGVVIGSIVSELVEGTTNQYIWQVPITLPVTETFSLSISNTTTSNVRVDNVELVVGAPKTKPVIQLQYETGTLSINNGVAQLTKEVNVSLDNPLSETDMITCSVPETANWLTAVIENGKLKITAQNPVYDKRSAAITLSAPGAANVVYTLTQNAAGISNPTVTVQSNTGGFEASWNSISNAIGYSCYYATNESATSGTSLQVSEADGKCSVSASGLEDGTYYLFIQSQATSPYIAPSDKVVKTIVITSAGGQGDKYELCTSSSDLVSGGQYIIASGSANSVYCISNVSNANNRKAVATTVSNSVIVVDASSTIMTFTLGGSSDAWTLHTDNYTGDDGYLASAASGKNNYCRVIADETTCTISFSNNAAVINIAPHTERTLLRYNYNNGSPLFACYSSGQNPVYLFKKQ